MATKRKEEAQQKDLDRYVDKLTTTKKNCDKRASDHLSMSYMRQNKIKFMEIKESQLVDNL